MTTYNFDTLSQRLRELSRDGVYLGHRADDARQSGFQLVTNLPERGSTWVSDRLGRVRCGGDVVQWAARSKQVVQAVTEIDSGVGLDLDAERRDARADRASAGPDRLLGVLRSPSAQMTHSLLAACLPAHAPTERNTDPHSPSDRGPLPCGRRPRDPRSPCRADERRRAPAASR